MELLPDTPLIRMMQHLSVDDLLACRLVSKRIGAAALHPDAWLHQRLGRSKIPGDANKCVCPVLRFAPHLDELGEFLTPRPAPCRLADFPVRCAVAELAVSVCEDADAAADTLELVRRQAALGRLRSLTVRLYGLAPGGAAVETVVSTPGLEHLDVGVHYTTGGRIVELPAMAAPALHTVRHFECNLSTKTEAFVNSILAEHATTLERVNLSDDHRDLLSLTSTAPLLAAMTHLRELECAALPGLRVLASCESLRVLRLTFCIDIRHKGVAEDAVELLRDAVQLREVTLSFKPDVGYHSSSGTCVGEFCLAAIPALASSRESRVEKLVVHNSVRSMFSNVDPRMARSFLRGLPQRRPRSALLQPLTMALPSLLALRHLSTDEDPDLLLAAVSPASAPALRSVGVILLDEVCAHAWLHGDTVQTVLDANPSLHIELSARTLCCSEPLRPSCERACALGCHQVLAELVEGDAQLVEDERRLDWHLGLFSHGPGECSHVHKTEGQRQRLWIHIP
ncbi:uncharacterized protein LOC113201843 [Frankliniella occidentalis]|uniref:Uncharacterized protein LOC113201843 n=1 Tax=Frankliniella occidentalis TaxID=133901 RepID=A0A6J1RR56_FRAOC|nr:uncharacterized protein LOC113201843 [Frankliniella occidentalis]